jgi:RNA polymerase sigma factor (sigma-70 family)
VGDQHMLNEPETRSYLPTRQSLLSRLRDCEDQAGWREFFERYWRLLYNVARKSGLADAEAQDVVQNTFIYLTRKMPKFQYDPARGSFKSWLRVVMRSRIAVMRRAGANSPLMRDPLKEGEEAFEEIPDPSADALDEVWQREWEENLLQTAVRHVRTKASARQLLIFRLATQEGFSLTQVAKKLNVNIAQVYMARHRVGKLFKAEVERLRKESE